MLLQREIDAIGWRIRLVDADRDAVEPAQRRDRRAREAFVVVVDDADVPRPRFAGVDRREGVDGNEPRFAAYGV